VQRFPRNARLLTPESFKSVFADGRRFSYPGVSAVVRDNAGDGPRLGLAIAKKVLKRAVARNRVKRWTRESFRRKAAGMAPVDVVIMVRPECTKLPPAQIRDSLDRLWARLQA
jgi:ribonuclease P protein component